jgi:putative ABC transport system permease protein
MSYALLTLWFDRQRYLPGVLAVAFSALLIALQCGLLFGLLSITSIPIDRAAADVWIGSPKVLSVDIGQPITVSKMESRLASQPEVAQVEPYIEKFANWEKPTGGIDLCIIIGTNLDDDSIGAVPQLTPKLRELLTGPDTVVVDESELERLDIQGVDDTAKIAGRTVRIVGLVRGMKSIAGPYVFCSMGTARAITRLSPDQCVYMLAKCHDPKDAEALVARLKDEYVADNLPDMSAYSKQEFSRRSRMHWLTKTKGGVALGYAAFLGLIVGAVVTSQTLYAATMASVREYAILLALGIPRWRISRTVLTQAWWIGVLGVLVSFPAIFGMAKLAGYLGVNPQLDPELLAGASAITLGMALVSGIIALRSIRQIEPISLLR